MYKRLSAILVSCLCLIVGTLNAQTPNPTLPKSGDWLVTEVQELNNCPDQFLPENRWTVEDGAVYSFNFTTLDSVLVDLHEMLDERESIQNPSYYTFTTADYNQYEIYPNIMTQPYTYRYAVLDAEHIIMEYTQTIALSNCQLIISYNINYLGDAGMGGMGGMTSAPSQTADLHAWGTMGDAIEMFTIPESATAICATDGAMNETWYFMADDAFVDAVRFGYGETLNYDLKLLNTGNRYHDAPDIILVIGNGGFEMHYQFDYALDDSSPTTEWQSYSVMLDELAGWVEPEGVFELSDRAVFREVLELVAQVWIRGEYIVGDDQACIDNVSVGSGSMEEEALVDFGAGLDADFGTTSHIAILNGLYEVTLSQASDTCHPMFGVGSIYQMHYTFGVSENGASLEVWMEGTEFPTRYRVDNNDPNFYQTEGGDFGSFAIITPTDFVMQNDLDARCSLTYSGHRLGN